MLSLVNSQQADSKTHTYSIVMGRPPQHDVTIIRATEQDARDFVLKNHPDRRMVLRGYTTWRIYSGNQEIGSFQRVAAAEC